jgi:hypothetical protein
MPMSPALLNNVILSFLFVLVLLLTLMLGAVIRTPPPGRSEPAEEEQPAPPVPVWTVPPRPRPAAAQASATATLIPLSRTTGRIGKARYSGRHAAGRRPSRSPIRLTGSPPWEPAPQPPGQRP